MSDGAPHLTMRDLQRLLLTPRFWVLVAAAVLAAAFGTFERLPLLLRLVYSFAMTAISVYITVGIVGLLFRLVDRHSSGFLLQMAGIGFAAGVPAAIFIAAVNSALFQQSPSFRDEFSSVVPFVCLVAACISFVCGLVINTSRETAADGETWKLRMKTGHPALLGRLPPHLRGTLSHLSMHDGHVEVFTDKGSSIVPIGMANAIRETKGVDGFQVHLYHWVARNSVARTVRWDERMFVEMRDGSRLPVSRSKQEALREAGLA